MTSGPMPTGALPPEPHPDPQVVAWMREYMQGHPFPTKVRTVAAWLDAHGYDSFTASGRTLPELTAAANAASLFLMPDSYGDLGVWYRAEGDPGAGLVAVIRGEGIEGPDALIAHLRATLPTIGATEDAQ